MTPNEDKTSCSQPSLPWSLRTVNLKSATAIGGMESRVHTSCLTKKLWMKSFSNRLCRSILILSKLWTSTFWRNHTWTKLNKRDQAPSTSLEMLTQGLSTTLWKLSQEEINSAHKKREEELGLDLRPVRIT